MVDLEENPWPALESPGGEVHVDGMAPDRRLALLGVVHLRLTLDPALQSAIGTTCKFSLDFPQFLSIINK